MLANISFDQWKFIEEKLDANAVSMKIIITIIISNDININNNIIIINIYNNGNNNKNIIVIV